MSDQKTHLDTTLQKIISNNKREIAETERECLDKKHHLIRGSIMVPRKKHDFFSSITHIYGDLDV